MKNTSSEKINNIQNFDVIKTIIVLVAYFTYNLVISSLLMVIGLNSSISSFFISDLLFLLGVIIIYRQDIKTDFKSFNNEGKISKKILTVLFWILMIFVVNLLFGAITNGMFDSSQDSNTSALYSLGQESLVYMVFKTLVFSIVAEELVFKKSISKVINSKILIVILSSLFYAIANIIYCDLTSLPVWIDALGYFVIYLITSIMYVKHNNNIFLVMIVKFFYNLIPLAIMFKMIGG